MATEHHHQPDYGTAEKKISVYLVGLAACIILTIISFWVVMSQTFSWTETVSIIYLSACLQFLVQVIFFVRLNTQTVQGRMNVMSLIFTGVILLSVVVGSLWIMWSLNYYTM